MKYKLEIKGKVQPKERPRLGKYGNVYTPRATERYEDYIKAVFRKKYPNSSISYSLFQARIIVWFATPIYPKATYKDRIFTFYKGKQDVDNLAKSILDSLNKVAYYDDSQVVKLEVQKIYGVEDKAFIELKEIEVMK